MQDPRTIFYLPEDHQVIVYMEWDGPVGNHHIEGFWKNPDGKVVALSDFSYDAKDKRFGAFWPLAISETMLQGTWTLEARVDGQPAGSHSFEILSGAKPADQAPQKHLLKTSELYDLAVKSSVLIEKLDAGGKPVGTYSGFVLEPSWVVTAFEAIDGASKVRMTFPDGRRVDASDVSTWNRRQDWAVFVLASDTTKTDPLKRAPVNTWNIGDNVSILSSSPSGNRVIGSFSISGK
jgi:S1-C subfamily serine protease